jgi:hypothetical protein
MATTGSAGEAFLGARLEAMVRASPTLMRVLTTLETLALPDWRVASGAVFQTVWNALTGRPPDYGIKDYDVLFFDWQESWEAEDAVIRRVAAAFPPELAARVEVRNQARVHLWFSERFGCNYPQLRAADDSLRYYASIVHAVGVRLEQDGTLDIAAPFGLDDMFAMVIRPNRTLANDASHAAKATRAKAIWPEVVVEPWQV